MHISELIIASLTFEGVFYIIIASSFPSPSLGVPCLYLPFGIVIETKFVDG